MNPFASELALENSSYCRIIDGHLVIGEGEAPRRMTEEVHAALHAVLQDPDYPCVGAKSVIHQQSYRFGLYSEIGSAEATAGLAFDLYQFAQERPHIEGEFTSYIASFLEPKLTRSKDFEALLWTQLHSLHDLDKEFFEWNPQVSHDPNDPAFSFSFAGEAYFVVGLSPANKRWARRFPWPTLVFNDHFQFERLREEDRFDRIRDTIRERDNRLHGTPNPMLSDYGGAHSEARQYSGRSVKDDWQCPVHFDKESS